MKSAARRLIPAIRDEAGIAAVEFALVLPILCAALLGIMDGWSYVTGSLSMRYKTRLDWDEKKWTVEQEAVKPHLKLRYREPWKLEV